MDYLRHQQQIEARLWAAASATATAAGVVMDAACEQLLRDEIRRGASRMLGSGLVMDPSATGRAYAGTVALVHAMVEGVRERGHSILDRESLADGLRRLCPLFPFC
ncbi:MAG TPA: hypothetical protein VEW03_03255 [Longimicrobiaceae bacterium]|nr:hypothetical protein [Longimicrobiaceae bacterium]